MTLSASMTHDVKESSQEEPQSIAVEVRPQWAEAAASYGRSIEKARQIRHRSLGG